MKLSNWWMVALLPACATDMDVEGQSLDEGAEVAAEANPGFSTLAGDVEDKCDFLELLSLVEAPRWGRIPLIMPAVEIHTCDGGAGGTDSPAWARLQIAGKTYEQRIDNPGGDRNQGHTDAFYLPVVSGGPYQMEDLQAITIRKEGTDGWCMDRVALLSAGQKVWEYKADDANSGHTLHPAGASGNIELRPGAQEVTFTDLDIQYANRSRHGKFEIEIRTCDGGEVRSTAPEDVRVRWKHDGFVETEAILPGLVKPTPHGQMNWPPKDRRSPNWLETDLIAEDTAMEKLDWLRLEAKSSATWCVQSIRLLANGQEIYTDNQVRSLGGDKKKWIGFEVTKNKPVETGNRKAFLGRPLARGQFAGRTNAELGLMPNAPRAFCSPPGRISKGALEGTIATIFTNEAWGDAFWGGSGYVHVSRASNTAAHAKLRFEADAPGFGNAVVWLDLDLNVKCGDPDPENDDDNEVALLLEPGPITYEYDAPALTDMLNFLGVDIKKKIRAAIPALEPRSFDTGNQCPDRSVQSDGDIIIDWNDSKVENVLCKADSSKWPRLAQCARDLDMGE